MPFSDPKIPQASFIGSYFKARFDFPNYKFANVTKVSTHIYLFDCILNTFRFLFKLLSEMDKYSGIIDCIS